MRTIRNIAFVVLCAMVYLASEPVKAGTSCWADYAYSDSAGDHYQGECDPCDENAWYDAISACEPGIMVEYFCASWHFEYVCHNGPIMD